MILCRSLGVGGTERQIIILAKGLRQRGHRVGVLVFYGGGELEHELHEQNIPVFDMHKTGRWDTVPFLFRCAQAARRFKPTVLYGFLATPNLLGLLLKTVVARIPIVWGVRASNVDLSHYDWLSRLVFRAECGVSSFADLIICNSRAGLEYVAAHGFPRRNMIVIPNGIDVDRFRPDAALRVAVRREWSIARNEILIGLVGRLDPMKDHATFFQAAALLSKRRYNLRFVCVGDGPEPYKSLLFRIANDLGLTANLIWAGDRRDMSAVYNALDISVSASCTEGFSNTIAESMSCGVPCVVTDVGDSAHIVGHSGEIVPPHAPAVLAEALDRMLLRLNSELSKSGRDRVDSQFSVDALILRTIDALYSVTRSEHSDADRG